MLTALEWCLEAAVSRVNADVDPDVQIEHVSLTEPSRGELAVLSRINHSHAALTGLIRSLPIQIQTQRDSTGLREYRADRANRDSVS